MINVDGHGLSLTDLWNVVKNNAEAGMIASTTAKMKASRALVEDLAAQPRAIYGINTGFGPLSGSRVSPQDLRKHQVHLLHHLSVGQGPLFGEDETRSIMLARANALARGYSGIRVEVVDCLLEALNRGYHPEIPSEGSIGASGDLVPLAHMARFMIGLGHVRKQGQRFTSLEALTAMGRQPIVLEAKEAIALVNGTSAMTGLVGLATHESAIQLSWMEFLTAGLFQVMSGEPEVLCSQAHYARGHRGQTLVAERIAQHLKSNLHYQREIEEHLWGSHSKPLEWGIEIQDPYSLRCVPQILGAFQDAWWHIEQVITRELNASTDNPLIFPETQSVIHNGNFYGQHVAMVSDYLRMGVIKMILLCERQLDRLVNWRYSHGLPPMLTGATEGLNSGFMGAQLLATSIAADARLLGMPGSIQTIPSNANNQDVVSMGMSSAKLTHAVVPKLWTLLAIQSMALVQAADFRNDEKIFASGFGPFYTKVREIFPKLVEDRPLYEEIAACAELLRNQAFQQQILPLRPQGPLEIR